MSSAEMRKQMEAEQTALLRSLVAGADPPEGFDAERLQAAADSLARKRRQAVMRCWPSLVRLLQDDFRQHFDAFAQETPLPEFGGPLADGATFAEHLRHQQALSDEVCREVLAIELRFRRVRGGLIRRRGPAVRLARLPESRRRILAVRIPGLGEWWWT